MTPSPDPVVVVGGGQSGIAAARAVHEAGLRPLLLEAGDRPGGSWPAYYDSLTLFSPARFSALPGLPFPGDPDRYPVRDEVTDYLRDCAGRLGTEIRTRTRAEAVEGRGPGFLVRTTDGEEIPAGAVIAASGSFSRPHVPRLPDRERYTGTLLHAADYRSPEPFANQRVVVVGAGNSAVQIAHELAAHATVTLATRAPLRFLRRRVLGRDIHHWLAGSGFDHLPAAWLGALGGGTRVLDTGVYERALAVGRMDRRPVFRSLDGDGVVWSDGTREPVDTVLLATGYRPSLDYLRGLGALDADGAPLHSGGISTTHPGLAYVGLEFQRSFSSNTLRGVSRDAGHVVRPLAAWVRGAGRPLT
ncbi:NAD(P)/FAD-dependent oxidoreductase [Streptomyces sp. ACA25]|uniref:flavin-containing monooxygenase n=1 Tax=Streptomyces sp. ACA25 TaxID=3022596 RepID=UPI0023082E50|nr:NAD(P)/FAD-dependent oxidoreductase [Streptomyces sp. ACA25]MDB1088237.1 NAD(P)/FAD-dependent oxidoreductase [Streptomyces sp. ACA25]